MLVLCGPAGVQDGVDGGGAGNVVGEDEEAVFAGDDAQAVALAKAGEED